LICEWRVILGFFQFRVDFPFTSIDFSNVSVITVLLPFERWRFIVVFAIYQSFVSLLDPVLHTASVYEQDPFLFTVGKACPTSFL